MTEGWRRGRDEYLTSVGRQVCRDPQARKQDMRGRHHSDRVEADAGAERLV